MSNPFEFNPILTSNKKVEEPVATENKSEKNVEKTKPFDLEFYVTDHSADNADTGNQERLRELYEDVKKDGIKSIRFDYRWNKIETEKGEFQDELLDRYGKAIEVMNEAGLESPTVVLSSIPNWALEIYKKDKEKFFDEYRKYVEEVKSSLTKSYEKTGQLVFKVQVLNELNNSVYTPIDGHDVSRLCDITREVLHDYNPDVKLMATAFAGNLPKLVKDLSFGRVNLGTHIEEYLKQYRDVLESFDIIAIDYYPGMWHVPIGEAMENKKEIFKQLGLLKNTMEEVASWGKEYELGEVGIQTNMPLMGDEHNQDRQRYFFDVFFREFKHILLDFQRRGIKLPTRIGLYQAMDEPPKNMTGKILRKITPFPEHDMGMRKGDSSRKEILQGNRHSDEGEDRGDSQLSKIIKYINSPVRNG